jgi:hypothetical protein
MLQVKKNEVNRLVVTVSQHKTTSSPYYLFSFEHIQSKEKVRFIALLNNSPSQVRYDEFWIEETNTQPEDLITEIPVVTFPYTGQYWYSIYETSSLNLDPQSSIDKIEEGRCVVVDSSEENYIEYQSNNEDNSQFIYIS